MQLRRGFLVGSALVVFLSAASAEAAVNIACVGDSITFGANLASPSTQAYPPVLAGLLGSGFTVKNFGHSGTTMLKAGDYPYWTVQEFTASDAFAPNIVIIMLGTNDSKPQNWGTHSADFPTDYKAMIQHYRDLGATVFVALPPPVYDPGAFNISPTVLNDTIVPEIRVIASDASAPLIDVFTPLSNHPEYFPDTVHPNAAGDQVIAQTVYDALIANGVSAGGASAGGAGGNGGASSAGASAGGAAAGAAGTTTTNVAATGGSGCSCRVGSSDEHAPSWLLLSAIGLFFRRVPKRRSAKTG